MVELGPCHGFTIGPHHLRVGEVGTPRGYHNRKEQGNGSPEWHFDFFNDRTSKVNIKVKLLNEINQNSFF